MAGLLDLIQKRRIANVYNQRAGDAESGLYSTTPPPNPDIDFSAAPDPAAPTLESTEVARRGQGPRFLEAGTEDVQGGFENALAATSAALGGDVLAGKLHAAAQEHAARAEALTPDQTKDIRDIHGAGDLGHYVFGQVVRGAPMLGTAALGGAVAAGAGLPALAGVAIPSLALNTGAAYGEMADQPGVDRQAAGRHALVAGAGGAALDSLAFGYAAKLSPFAKQALGKLVSESLPGHVLRSALAEGTTGAAREAVNQVAVKHLLGNPDLFNLSDEDKMALANAAAQNAAATAPLGVAGHFKAGVGAGIDKAIDLAAAARQKAQPHVEAAQEAAQPYVEKAGDMAGKASDFVREQATKAADFVKENAPGAAEKAADLAGQGADFVKQRAPAAGAFVGDQVRAVQAGFRAMAEAAKEPDVPGVQKSQAGSLSYDAKLIRGTLNDLAPTASHADATLLAKRLEKLLTMSPARFEEFTNQPEVAQHLKGMFDMTPDVFREHIYDRLRNDPKSMMRDELLATKPDKMASESDLFDAKNHAVDANDATLGEHLAELDHSDIFNNVGSPDETGARHPGMTAEMFGHFLPTESQVKAGTKAGSNAWVNVTRTTKDPATGEVIGTETSPKQVNLVNISKAWGPQRELSEKAKAVGESTQEKFDGNFKDGLSALLNGWHETDEKGNAVDVTVQPARQSTKDGQVGAVDKADLNGWLRPDSVVGTNGQVRTFANVQQSGKANSPVDINGAIDKYHADIEAASKRGHAAAADAAAKGAGNVVRMAVERLTEQLNDLPPERQQQAVEATMDFVKDPHQEPGLGVAPVIARLPKEILTAGGARLMAELSDLNMKIVQPRLHSEQETSVDAPIHSETQEAPGKVTEDLSGQHIDYAATQAAGLADLKRKYADAKTVPGRAVARKALEAALPKA